MNRAEKRRQQKLAKKAARNINPVEPTVSSPADQSVADQNALDLATQHHTAGRLAEAEHLYRQVLQSTPDHPVALHLLGVVALQGGKFDVAIDLITKAIAINPNFAEAHSNLGAAYRSQGNLDAAIASYNKAVSCNPDYADALYNLANTLKQLDRMDEAIASLRKVISINPQFAEAHNNLGNALKEKGNLKDAVKSFNSALSVKPDYTKAYNNLGTAHHDLGDLKAAEESYLNALSIEPGFAEAHNNLGNTLLKQNRLDEAVASYYKAQAINPHDQGTCLNLADALKYQGQAGEAINTLQAGLQREPNNTAIIEPLIEILNYHMPKDGLAGIHFKAQQSLQQIGLEHTTPGPIADETVETLFQECQSILASCGLNGATIESQIWRGIIYDPGCSRHMVVFNSLDVIPEFCFGCFKVSVEPENVMDLIKLMLVFSSLELPNDNTRKCFVEIRPDISGDFKGLIYCQNLEDAREVERIVQPIIIEKISSEISIQVKRGCSEFPASFPEFSAFDDNGMPTMAYNKEWREQEDYADKNLVDHKYPPAFNSHNHSGLTLRDVLVMHTWLAYAKMIGDASYLKISRTPVEKLRMDDRSAFHSDQMA